MDMVILWQGFRYRSDIHKRITHLMNYSSIVTDLSQHYMDNRHSACQEHQPNIFPRKTKCKRKSKDGSCKQASCLSHPDLKNSLYTSYTFCPFVPLVSLRAQSDPPSRKGSNTCPSNHFRHHPVSLTMFLLECCSFIPAFRFIPGHPPYSFFPPPPSPAHGKPSRLPLSILLYPTPCLITVY